MHFLINKKLQVRVVRKLPSLSTRNIDALFFKITKERYRLFRAYLGIPNTTHLVRIIDHVLVGHSLSILIIDEIPAGTFGQKTSTVAPMGI